MKKNIFRLKTVAGLLLLPATLCAWGGAPDSVVTEVLGFAAADAGRSLAELHREAVGNALENAVAQTQIELDLTARVDGMRLAEHRVHVRSMGYVESSRVLDAGFVPTTNSLAVYRVRMEVSVRPISENGTFSDAKDRRFPAVALELSSGQGAEHGKACRETLAASLRECGIRVVASGEDPHAFPVRVALARSTRHSPWEIRWEMGRPSREPSVAVREYLQVPAGDLVSSAELDRLGVRIARDALRFWGENAVCGKGRAVERNGGEAPRWVKPFLPDP